MNLTESIRNALNEGKLKWITSDADAGSQEAVLSDGSKFVLKSFAGSITVNYVPASGRKGNTVYHTPAAAPGAFMKAKQAAENFLDQREAQTNEDAGSRLKAGKLYTYKGKVVKCIETGLPGRNECGWFRPVNGGKDFEAFADELKQVTEEELGPDREWGTPSLTQQNKEATPGQNEALDDACWKGYKAVGTKEKDGKTVPNCVPEDIESNRGEQDQRLADIESIKRLIAHPDTEFAIDNYGSVERYRQMLKAKLERLQKNEAITGAKLVTLKDSDKLEVKYGSLIVNGRPFEITDPDESLDWPKGISADGKLITWFKGDKARVSEWDPSDITGYYSDREGLKSEAVSEKLIRAVSLIAEDTNRDLIEDFVRSSVVDLDEPLRTRSSYLRFRSERLAQDKH